MNQKQKLLLYKISLALLMIEGCAKQNPSDVQFSKRMYQTHIVQKGETTKSISKKYGMDKKVLEKINNIETDQKLIENQVLQIHKKDFSHNIAKYHFIGNIQFNNYNQGVYSQNIENYPTLQKTKKFSKKVTQENPDSQKGVVFVKNNRSIVSLLLGLGGIGSMIARLAKLPIPSLSNPGDPIIESQSSPSISHIKRNNPHSIEEHDDDSDNPADNPGHGGDNPGHGGDNSGHGVDNPGHGGKRHVGIGDSNPHHNPHPRTDLIEISDDDNPNPNPHPIFINNPKGKTHRGIQKDFPEKSDNISQIGEKKGAPIETIKRKGTSIISPSSLVLSGIACPIAGSVLKKVMKKKKGNAQEDEIISNITTCDNQPCFLWPIHRKKHWKKRQFRKADDGIYITNSLEQSSVQSSASGTVKKIKTLKDTSNKATYTIVINHCLPNCNVQGYQTTYSGLSSIPKWLKVGKFVTKEMEIGKIKKSPDKELFFAIHYGKHLISDIREELPGEAMQIKAI